MTRPVVGPALAVTFTVTLVVLLVTSPVIAGLVTAAVYPFAHALVRWCVGR
jgi:hypothetical protein